MQLSFNPKFRLSNRIFQRIFNLLHPGCHRLNPIVTIKNITADFSDKDAMFQNAIKIKSLEAEIQNLKALWATKENGLGLEGSKEDAIAWLNEKLKTLTGTVLDCYAKGKYKGILFAKFESKKLRDSSVESFRKASFSRSGSRCWASEDSPIEDRARRSFVFGVKKLLTDWGFGKFETWVDTNDYLAFFQSVDGWEYVASASISASKNLEFDFGEGW